MFSGSPHSEFVAAVVSWLNMLKFSWFSRIRWWSHRLCGGRSSSSSLQSAAARSLRYPGRTWNGNYIRADSLKKAVMNMFLSHPRNHSRVCLLSGTRMAQEDALYLIGHFRPRATQEPTLHQARINWFRCHDTDVCLYRHRVREPI